MSVAEASETHLGYLLRSSGQLSLFLAALRSALWWIAIVVSAVLLAVVVDGLLGLDPWGLVASDLTLLGLSVAGAVAFVRTIAANWLAPRQAARLVESRLGLSDGRLVTAWDLSEAPPKHASPQLVQHSVKAANEYAQSVPLGETVQTRPLIRTSLMLGAVLLVAVAGGLIMPRMSAAVLTRLADPWGDHPPFTLVEFAVSTDPDPVFHGRSATIVARLSGPEEVERANVVFVEQPHVPVVMPMLRRPEGEFVLPIERAETSREFYIDTPRGRSGRHRLTVLPVPTFEATHVRYAFPKYTAWPEASHVLDPRGLQALAGTNVTLTVTSNVPLKSGTLVLRPREQKKAPTTITLLPVRSAPATVTATFPLTFSGLFQLRLTGADGTPGRDHLEGPVVPTEDRPPQVEILEPAPLTLAVENWQVPVLIVARDDVAVDALVLQASVNGWGPHAQEVAIEKTIKTSVRGDYLFHLGNLGASAGDIITFYVTARDNRPPAGQSVDTPVYVIQVISEAEYLEFARSKYRMEDIVEEFEELQKKLDDLDRQRDELLKEAEALKEALKDGSLSPEDVERLEKLQTQLEGLEQEAAKLAEELAKRAEQTPLYDFEENYRDMLQQLSKQMQEQAAAARAAREAAEELRKNPNLSPEALQNALEQLEQKEEGLDAESLSKRKQTAEDLEKLRLADEMLAQAERLQSLVRQQRDLADRMAELRDAESLTPEQQERARQLAKEQELLEQELHETTEELEKLSGQCEKCLPRTSGDAKKLCQAIREGQITGDQQGAAKSARGGKGKDAAERAAEAARKLEALQCESCNGDEMGEEMNLDAGLKLSKAGAKQSLKQLAQGRQVPGMGMKPGRSQKSGEQGQGQGGSPNRVTIAGPHQPSAGRKESRSGKLGEGGRGQGETPDQDSFGGGPESIDPQSRTGRTTSAGNLRGVPVRYRDQAEAFFKRLAEERNAK